MKLLFINTSPFASGAEKSMIELLKRIDYTYFEAVVVLPIGNIYQHLVPEKIKCINLPLIWFVKSVNPVYLIRCFKSIAFVTIKLMQIIREEKIEIVYSNTTKACPYIFILSFFIRNCKFICHIRDNIRPKLFLRVLINRCDKVLCVSEYISNQLKKMEEKKLLLYGGIDINPDNNNLYNTMSLKKQLCLSKGSVIVAQIGQLSRWKNQTDFIKAAKTVKNYCQEAHFVIIGDNLSGKENKYKHELINLIDKMGLTPYVSFLGQREDARELISQIDILVHPSINEPFGRVLIESMIMRKPVLAYSCGGPKEIVVNGVTGYLVEPNNVQFLAEKINILVKNRELRFHFGAEGRKRVIGKFNIERYVKEMEAVFNSI